MHSRWHCDTCETVPKECLGLIFGSRLTSSVLQREVTDDGLLLEERTDSLAYGGSTCGVGASADCGGGVRLERIDASGDCDCGAGVGYLRWCSGAAVEVRY